MTKIANALDDRDVSRKPGMRTSREKFAWAIILFAVGAIALGTVKKTYQDWAYNYWQARLVRGDAVTIRFICGTDVSFVCTTEVTISYAKREGKWCENLSRDGGPIVKGDWCNANPELGTVSVYGALHEFDRFGVVKRAGFLVGQMFRS